MDVTKENYEELLPIIKKAIYECDFLAIDTELTGLYSKDSNENVFDSSEEKYSKILKLCPEFLITQFGVSTFKYDTTDSKYYHKDFNFYIIPRTDIQRSPDTRFLCQTSSLHFLASYGFDFNKWIYKGIPYMNFSQEEDLKLYLSNKYQVERDALLSEPATKSPASKGTKIPDEQKEFIEEIHQQIATFFADPSQSSIDLKPCNGYQRLLIYESVHPKYPDGLELTSETDDSNMRFIRVTKASRQEKLDNLEAKQKNIMNDLDANVGFRKVMEYISDSKKLVLGHNMYLDMLHVMGKFFFELPQDLKEFKSMVRMSFPRILDTKYLSSCEKLKQHIELTWLGKLFETVQKPPFKLPELSPGGDLKCYQLDGTQPHEAGFDAFMTGVVFLGLSAKLGSESGVEHVEPSSKLLTPFVNKVFAMRNQLFNCMNLCGPDPIESRDHVFHISFPKQWKSVDIVEQFVPYGEVSVHWIDDVSALVALKNERNSVRAAASLVNKANKPFKVVPYVEFQRTVLGAATHAVDSSRKQASSTSDNNAGLSTKRKSSVELSCSMECIPEEENEADTTDDTFTPPPVKKLKTGKEQEALPSPVKRLKTVEAQEVVSSSLFEENHEW